MPLFDYQKKAAQFILRNPYGGLIWLTPGSGKSKIIYACIRKVGTALIVAPNMVKYEHLGNLPDELAKREHILIKSGKQKIPKVNGAVYLCTPELLDSIKYKLRTLDLKFVAFDESQYFTNYESKRTRAAFEVSYGVKTGCFTGTAAPEGDHQLFGQILLISDQIVGSASYFKAKHERTRLRRGFPTKYYVHMSSFRRRCDNHIFTLPAKRLNMPEQVIKKYPLEMRKELRDKYEEYESTCRIWDEKISLIDTTSPHVRLRQLSSGFIKDAVESEIQGRDVNYFFENYKLEFLVDMLKHYEGEQFIVWGNLTPEIDKVYSKLLNEKFDVKTITGSTKNPGNIIENFKSGKLRGIVANTACLGAGVSFQNCRLMFYMSFPVKARDFMQSIKRTNRKSQKRQEIVHFIYYARTVEEKLFRATQEKDFNQQKLMEEYDLYGK